MRALVAKAGLAHAMAAAGFERISTRNRNPWYRERARQELAAMRGPLIEEACASSGRVFVSHNIGIWSNMLPVLASGERCPTRLGARRPE